MLDTVILLLNNFMFTIIEPNKFSPPLEGWKEYNPSGFKKYINNPTPFDKKNDIYKPRLTAIKRGASLDLKIEFSAPKLLNKNNVDELTDEDFPKILNKLQRDLKEMGIGVFTNFLENANVLSFHPSKNILLKNGMTSSYIIKEFKKIDLNKNFDITEAQFRNNGQSIQHYSISSSFVMYDKVADLNKSQKRAIDKEQTKTQIDIFNILNKKEDKNIEILRFELRLSGKKKMNQVLKNLGYQENPKFKDIFKKEVCKSILKSYLNNIIAGNLFIFDLTTNKQKILSTIILKQDKKKFKQALYLYALLDLCKDEDGVTGLRSITESLIKNINWSKIKKDLQELNKLDFVKKPDYINEINKQIEEFKPLHIYDEIKPKEPP